MQLLQALVRSQRAVEALKRMREVAARRRMAAFFTRYFAYIQQSKLDHGFSSTRHKACLCAGVAR